MKKKFILSSLLLLTGLFAVGCSNTDPEASTNDSSIENVSSVAQDVSMNESQIQDVVSAGLEKEPYTSGDVTFIITKCEVDVSAPGASAQDIEMIKETYVSQYLSTYASIYGEENVAIGQPIYRTFNQEQCSMLRLGSDFLEKYTGVFEKNYYQKPDGNYVMELTQENSQVNQGTTQQIRAKNVVSFDERSYIVHEEVTTSVSVSTAGATITMETVTTDDIVYH